MAAAALTRHIVSHAISDANSERKTDQQANHINKPITMSGISLRHHNAKNSTRPITIVPDSTVITTR
jgi:hypothetical protein